MTIRSGPRVLIPLGEGCILGARPIAPRLPCTFEESNNACFIVRDANNFAVAYVYFESEPGRRVAANLMTKDEARRIAIREAAARHQTALLPDLLIRY
jgi:hypothetical protein